MHFQDCSEIGCDGFPNFDRIAQECIAPSGTNQLPQTQLRPHTYLDQITICFRREGNAVGADLSCRVRGHPYGRLDGIISLPGDRLPDIEIGRPRDRYGCGHDADCAIDARDSKDSLGIATMVEASQIPMAFLRRDSPRIYSSLMRLTLTRLAIAELNRLGKSKCSQEGEQCSVGLVELHEGGFIDRPSRRRIPSLQFRDGGRCRGAENTTVPRSRGRVHSHAFVAGQVDFREDVLLSGDSVSLDLPMGIRDSDEGNAECPKVVLVTLEHPLERGCAWRILVARDLLDQTIARNWEPTRHQAHDEIEETLSAIDAICTHNCQPFTPSRSMTKISVLPAKRCWPVSPYAKAGGITS